MTFSMLSNAFEVSAVSAESWVVRLVLAACMNCSVFGNIFLAGFANSPSNPYTFRNAFANCSVMGGIDFLMRVAQLKWCAATYSNYTCQKGKGKTFMVQRTKASEPGEIAGNFYI
jgi:hypothetical protein